MRRYDCLLRVIIILALTQGPHPLPASPLRRPPAVRSVTHHLLACLLQERARRFSSTPSPPRPTRARSRMAVSHG
eukprot:6899456-Pyramimonas_sp.AAC.1